MTDHYQCGNRIQTLEVENERLREQLDDAQIENHNLLHSSGVNAMRLRDTITDQDREIERLRVLIHKLEADLYGKEAKP